MDGPRAPSEELIRLLSQYDLSVGELALKAREVVLEAVPSAVETLFESYALVFWYSLTGRMGDAYCYVAVYSKHVNLGFNRGGELKDTAGILEGDGKIMRHLKIKSSADLNNKSIKPLVKAAEKNAKTIAASKSLAKAAKPSRTKSVKRAK